MARTHSTYTASPTRWHSPRRSPTRNASQDGSQYEMDLDVLGLNSTFESTELDEAQKPKVDVVETSDIEGPEDFTMNMTYWMTADLNSAQQQIRSRKEANIRISEIRGDTIPEEDPQDTTAEGDKAIIEDSSRQQPAASPTRSKKGEVQNTSPRKSPSASSMENDEKVRSYLSALPDTEISEDALASTQLRIPRQNLLQVPSPKRSYQATVEDYDTPRKPTQETVIHHTLERRLEDANMELQRQVAELRSQLEQQENTSRSRTTELETLLQYTRTDLQAARNETYKQKDEIRDIERKRNEAEDACAKLEMRLKKQEEESSAKLEELGEELGLQNLSKLQSQRDDFEAQIQALEEAKRASDENGKERERLLQHLQSELNLLRDSHELELQKMRDAIAGGDPQEDTDHSNQHLGMQTRLFELQSHADNLQDDLEKATEEAKLARQKAEEDAALRESAQTTEQTQRAMIAELELRIEALQEQLETAQSHADTGNHELGDFANLQKHAQNLHEELDQMREEAAEKDEELEALHAELLMAKTVAVTQNLKKQQVGEQEDHIEQRLNAAQGHIESLEDTISNLRQQLAESHRIAARAQSDARQFEQDLEDANDRIQEAHTEANRRMEDIERKLTRLKESKHETDSRFRELQAQHNELLEEQQSRLEDVRDNAEDAVRKAGLLIEQERNEKRRLSKELRKTLNELDRLRQELATKTAEGAFFNDEDSFVSSINDGQVTEMESLRILLRKQASTVKALKTEISSMRKENMRLKTQVDGSSSETVITLQSEVSTLRHEIKRLKTEAKAREEDAEAVNKAMDERLASMMSKLLKERARSVVSKRDGQWADSVSKSNSERELIGKVLMREWGRNEVGPAKEGEGQLYQYKYVRKT